MYFAKVNPMQASVCVGNTMHCRANVRLSDSPQSFDEVAVWTTESCGGRGLHALGTIEHIGIQTFPNDRGPGEHEEFVMDIRVNALVTNPISKADLQTVKGIRDGSPMSALDQDALSQSHRKIKLVADDTARFLRSRFI